MGQALVFGLIGSSALAIGGVIGAYWRAPHRSSGVLLAFASGTLISALAFELFPEAVHLGGLWPAGLWLIRSEACLSASARGERPPRWIMWYVSA